MQYKGENLDEFKLTAENYYTPEANSHYLSIHDYIEHFGSLGRAGCQERGEAKRDGTFADEDTTAILVGQYVDTYFESPEEHEKFVKEHYTDIYTTRKTLRADFEKAEQMIQRAKADEYFMRYLKGQKQVIMTGLFAGLNWKIKIDNLMINKDGEPIAIVDLKTVGKSINQSWYIKDFGNVNFVEYWGYDLQMALYQEIVRVNTGKTLPCYIVAITKEKEPDIAVIGLADASGGNMLLNNALEQIKSNADAFKSIVTKEVEPMRCNRADCMYCRRTKKLTEPIFYQDLIMY